MHLLEAEDKQRVNPKEIKALVLSSIFHNSLCIEKHLGQLRPAKFSYNNVVLSAAPGLHTALLLLWELSPKEGRPKLAKSKLKEKPMQFQDN